MSDIKEKTFNRVDVKSPLLNEWLYPCSIKQTVTSDDKGIVNGASYSVSNAQNGLRCEVTIDDNTKLNLRCGFSLNESDYLMNVELSQYTNFEIEQLNYKTDFFELLNKVNLFNQFISLASLSSSKIIDITLYDNDNYQSLKSGKKHLRAVKLYYIDSKSTYSEIKKNTNFLFTYYQIELIFPNIIRKWYDVKNNVAPIRTHLLNSIKDQIRFDSLDFLIVAQSLEGYHLRFEPKLKKKNVTLTDRYTALIYQFKDVVKINISDREIKASVDSRNYYSHFYYKRKSLIVLDGLDLYQLTKKLRTLLICCTLSLIGFDNNTINELLSKSNNSKLS